MRRVTTEMVLIKVTRGKNIDIWRKCERINRHERGVEFIEIDDIETL